MTFYYVSMKNFFNFKDESTVNKEQLRSAVISRDDRKYYLDLKENERGRFLRISMVGINTARTQIAIPSEGVEELYKTLTDLMDEYGNEDDNGKINIFVILLKLPRTRFLILKLSIC